MGPVRRTFGLEARARKPRALFAAVLIGRDGVRLGRPVLWRRAIAAAIVLALTCAACGSASTTATTPVKAGDSSSAGAEGVSLSTATARGGGATASAAGGQPSAGSSVVTVAHISQPTTRAARAFAQMADNVCQVVRQGAPTTLARPITGPRLARYVKAANAVAARTVISLRRLASQRHSRALMTLAHAYKSLGALYERAARVTARRLNRPAAQYVGNQIEISEHALTTAAFDAGMPACGVNGA